MASGVVDTVYVSPGQSLPAGFPLLAVSAQSGMQVSLGIEAESVPLVREGDTISLEAVDRPGVALAQGVVRRVEGTLDARTRLAQMIVALPSDHTLLPGEYVKGTFEGRAVEALVAPHDAVLTTGEGAVVFTVVGGRAFHHAITVLAEGDYQTGFEASGVSEGDSLIVTGLVQLSDSLRIRPIR
jgi:hypothetical protein